MGNLKQTITRRWKLIVTLSIVFVVALITQDIIREVVVFQSEVDLFQDELRRDVQDDVYNLVNNVDVSFQHTIDELEIEALEHAQENIEPLLFAAYSIYDLHQTSQMTAIQQDIIDLTIIYNIDDETHLYYVYDTSGNQLYNGVTNEETLTPMIDSVDALNRQYLSFLLDGVSSSIKNEATTYFYQNEDGTIEQYALYGKEIEDTDLVLVSYVKLSQFSQYEKTESIVALSNQYDQYANQVFVLSTSGELLHHQNSEAIGLTLNDTTYPLWADTLQLIVDFYNEDTEGYLGYDFYSNYENGVIKDKIAYITYVEEWDIIIGASSDVDIYDTLFNEFIRDNYRMVLLVKIPSYLIILSISVFLFFFIRRNVNLSQRILHEEERLYRKFADLTTEIIIITDKQGQIVFTNKLGHNIIYGQREETQDIFFDQILIEEDGYYILYGVREDLFVKYITEEVEFNNQLADLFIIVDVTEKIRTERKLEALSQIDELTGLGNRRMMVKDYNDNVLLHVKDGGVAHLVMVDLDDFKPANDIYGHSYGDQVLANIASIFKEVSNPNVTFYRMGGDEFAILILRFTENEILEFIKDLQRKVGAYPYEKDINVGFSAGVAAIKITEKRRRFSDFYDLADKLLYKSKDAGKNMINF